MPEIETGMQAPKDEAKYRAAIFENAVYGARLSAKFRISQGTSFELSVAEAVEKYSLDLGLTQAETQELAKITMTEVFGKSRDQIEVEYKEDEAALLALCIKYSEELKGAETSA